MILNWILTPVLSFVAGLIGALPTYTGSFFDSIGTSSSGFTQWADTANYFFPIGIMLDCLGFVVLIFLPAVFVYELAQWGYRELPTIAGFGPSS